jgi:hypothetical protein
VSVTPKKVIRTATPAISQGKRRHSEALSEFRAPFLNGAQRSVNRKVQGSNPWFGAQPEYKLRRFRGRLKRLTTTAQQPLKRGVRRDHGINGRYPPIVSVQPAR